MKTYLPLLLLQQLLLGFDRCDCLTDSSVPAMFFPFGTDEGDAVLAVGHDNCEGPIDIPHNVFRTFYVSCKTRRLMFQWVSLGNRGRCYSNYLSVCLSVCLLQSLSDWKWLNRLLPYRTFSLSGRPNTLTIIFRTKRCGKKIKRHRTNGERWIKVAYVNHIRLMNEWMNEWMKVQWFWVHSKADWEPA